MKIMMIPGPRNEELIEKTRVAVYACQANGDDNYSVIVDLMKEYGESEIYDALYYVCDNAEAKLTEQANYFFDQIHYDDPYEFIDLMISA